MVHAREGIFIVSANRLLLDFSEIRAGLRTLLDSVSGTGEAAHIVEAIGNQAVLDIKSGYPSHTRDLINGVTGTFTRNPFGCRYVVTNVSKHALPFENGTQVRHTALGANRGAMPPGHVFIPVMERQRRRMYEQLGDLLRRQGLTVTGDA